MYTDNMHVPNDSMRLDAMFKNCCPYRLLMSVYNFFQVKLIESFTTVLESAGVMFPDEDEEGDFLVKLAKLVSVQILAMFLSFFVDLLDLSCYFYRSMRWGRI